MKTFTIQSTPITPEIIFDYDNSTILFNGKSLPEYGGTFYDDVEDKLNVFLFQIKDDLTIVFNLVYMNTNSNKRMLELFKKCKKSKPKLKIIWKHLYDDEIMKEEGETYEKILDIQFSYESYHD